MSQLTQKDGREERVHVGAFVDREQRDRIVDLARRRTGVSVLFSDWRSHASSSVRRPLSPTRRSNRMPRRITDLLRDRDTATRILDPTHPNL